MYYEFHYYYLLTTQQYCGKDINNKNKNDTAFPLYRCAVPF